MSDKDSSPRSYTVTELYEAATYAVYGEHADHGDNRKAVAKALAKRLGLTVHSEMPERLGFYNGRIVDASTRETVPGSVRAEAARCYNVVRQMQRYAEKRDDAEKRDGGKISGADYYSLLSLISAR